MTASPSIWIPSKGNPFRPEEYAGLRMDLRANLGGAVERVQVDIGIGDAVRPHEFPPTVAGSRLCSLCPKSLVRGTK